MTPAPDDRALYRCTVCDAEWRYEAIRHVARCCACGGALIRDHRAPVAVSVRRPRAVTARARHDAQTGEA